MEHGHCNAKFKTTEKDDNNEAIGINNPALVYVIQVLLTYSNHVIYVSKVSGMGKTAHCTFHS